MLLTQIPGRSWLAHAAPPHTALPSSVHRPYNPPITASQTPRYIWALRLRQTVSSILLHSWHMFAVLLISTNSDRTVTSTKSSSHDQCMHVQTCPR